MRHKILFVGQLPPEQTGATLSNAQLLQGLAGLGYEIQAVAPVTPTYPLKTRYVGDPQVAIKRLRVPGLRMFPPAERIAENFSDYAEILTRALPQLIERVKPSLIMVGDEGAVPAIPGLASRYGIPSLAIAHGPVLAMLRPDYPEAAARQVVPALRRVTRIVAVSAHMLAPLRQHGFTRTEAIANAVDIKRFHPRAANGRFRRRLGLEADDVLVLHISNLRPIKRPLDIVESAVLALRQEPRLHYVIAGEDPLREDMIDACETLGIRDRFSFVGWRPFPAIPHYYAASDVVLMTSAEEAAPLVYLEAQASARALLSSDIPAARDVIHDGETGLLFPVANIDALAEATVRLARDARLRADIGQRARDWVASNRALYSCVAAYADVIDRLIAGGSDHSRNTLAAIGAQYAPGAGAFDTDRDHR